MAARKVAIVLFNLGGPDQPDAVEPFLFNLFSDPAIIRLPQPFRWLIAKIVSRKRTPIAKNIYAQLGGGSPILPLTEDQARALEAACVAPNTHVRAFIAMRYWHPFSSEAAKAVKKWAPDEIVLLPLYPQYSTTTTTSSLNDWDRAAGQAGLTMPTRTVCCYPVEPGFIQAHVELLQAALATFPTRGEFRILFSAHGLPKRIVEAGDPYQRQVEATCAAVMTATEAALRDTSSGNVAPHDWVISYQSRVGPLEWIGPATDHEIERAGREGKSLIVVPIAFVSEHSETLVELDKEYGKLAADHGVPHYVRVPALGTHPRFIEALAKLVAEARASDGLVCPEELAGRPCGDEAKRRIA